MKITKKTISNFALAAMIIFFGMLSMSCNQKNDAKMADNKVRISDNEEANQVKATFIELGSKRCIPCQKMQPIMDSIETKYPNQVEVIFYDVWTPEGKQYADEYKINLIPTQVFLDKNGKEYFRHEGFFPQVELEKILKMQGVE